jgi:hypothetical protein
MMFNALEKLTGESKAQIENNVQLFLQGREKEKDRNLQGGIAVLQERGAAGRTAASIAVQKEIANMLPGESRAAMLLGTGDTDQARLESGLRKAQEISGNPKLIIEAYAKHSKEMTDALKTPMSAEAFAAQTLVLLEALKNKSSPEPGFNVTGSRPKN